MTERKIGRTIELVLCDWCKGKGHVLGINPDNPKEEDVKQPCNRCNSSGRLRWTTTVEMEPYK